MLINIFPYLSRLDVFKIVSLAGLKLPIGGIFILISIACMAFGEMFASPRIYQYIGAISPKGKEGLYLGYANLPIALGTIIGAPLGGFLFEKFISNRAPNEIFVSAPMMWGIVAFMGIISISGVYLYNKLTTERKK
jgi:predicted MFS family arabinose efflux permease